jgi:hypothetical protein
LLFVQPQNQKNQTMGTKKSKGQANMGSMVSYQELKKLGHGTSVARFGVDSQVRSLPVSACWFQNVQRHNKFVDWQKYKIKQPK